jgi:hypothetical protein
LSNLNGNVGKEGIEYVPKSKNNSSNYKNKKPTPLKMLPSFVKEGEVIEKENTIVGGDATRVNQPHNDFSRKEYPSSMLSKEKHGHFMLYLLVLLINMLNSLFRFQMPLSLTKKGPTKIGT